MHSNHNNPKGVTRVLNTLVCAVVLLCGLGVVGNAMGQGYFSEGPSIKNAVDLMPKGVGITEHLGDQIDPELTFTDSTGKVVKLGDYFDQGKPVVFTMVYYQCPMLCTFALNGARDVIKDLSWTPGSEYTVLAISFDPTEGPDLAAPKKESYIKSLERPAAGDGWHFLTGEETQIKKLTETLGFEYKWVEDEGQFAHASALIVATPDGHVSRYMNGVYYDPETLRLSLVEASGGKIGNIIENLSLIFCYRYDPESGSYAADAFKLMRLGGLLTVGFIVITVFALWRHEKKNKQNDNDTSTPHGRPHHA